MDGLPHSSPDLDYPGLSAGVAPVQRTLKTAICCAGAGLHSGREVRVTLRPAPANSGVVFRRTDLGVDIAGRFDRVTDTRLCTVVSSASEPQARVGTVEHLMAALAGCEVGNVVVELDGPELPVLDGSAEPWTFLLRCAGIAVQDAPVRAIEVLRTVRVQDGDAFAELRPGNTACLEMALSIAFNAPAIGRQALTMTLRPDTFAQIARARTFTLSHEIAGLQEAGLAQGGSLDNAVVVDGARVLNPGGLRMADEFVRHKLLDAVGDLALAGAPLHGRFVGHRSGHALNNRLLRALFADAANWRLATSASAHGWRESMQETAAAA